MTTNDSDNFLSTLIYQNLAKQCDFLSRMLLLTHKHWITELQDDLAGSDSVGSDSVIAGRLRDELVRLRTATAVLGNTQTVLDTMTEEVEHLVSLIEEPLPA